VNVADLRQHLDDLAKLLDASGGKSVAKDFAAIAEGLAPFSTQPLAEFSRFLVQAHEYHTTGTLAAAGKPARKAAPRAAKVKVDPAEIAAAVRALYDRANDLSLTMEHIDAELAKMSGLSKDGLLEVCGAMELVGLKSKKVDEIRASIRQKVLDRRGAAQRVGMIEEPTT